MGTGWLTCIPQVLLPHSPCRFTTANAPANRQMPIASVVMRHSKKGKKTDLRLKNLWRTVRFVTRLNESVTTEFADFRTFAWRTIPRRFSKERIGFWFLQLWQITIEKVGNNSMRTSDFKTIEQWLKIFDLRT